jgi:hypothetical protein
MQNIIGGLEAAQAIAAKEITADEAGNWVDVRFKEGLLAVVLEVGAMGATSIDWTFKDATSGAGAGSAAISPVNTLTQVTGADDVQIAFFDARVCRGYLQVTADHTGAGTCGVSAAVVSLPKY